MYSCPSDIVSYLFSHSMAEDSFVAAQGCTVNVHGNVYERGKAFSHSRKVEIARHIILAMDDYGNINVSKVAKAAKADRKVVRKIKKEMNEHGRVLTPKEINASKNCQRGAGSKAFSATDMFVLYQMYHNNPSTSLKVYAQALMFITGTQAHPSTISRWFRFAFRFSGTMCKPNMVPYDKFRPSNYEKALIYITVITLMDPARIKFGDEKHIKGNVLYCRKVRRDILTGIVPDIMTHPDFRQRYTIVGFCGIDPRVSPVRYGISVNTNDAANFSDQIVMAIHLCWLLPGDVLVLDNAAIHNGGDNSDLENWLIGRTLGFT
jgi:hypothetical protein